MLNTDQSQDIKNELSVFLKKNINNKETALDLIAEIKTGIISHSIRNFEDDELFDLIRNPYDFRDQSLNKILSNLSDIILKNSSLSLEKAQVLMEGVEQWSLSSNLLDAKSKQIAIELNNLIQKNYESSHEEENKDSNDFGLNR